MLTKNINFKNFPYKKKNNTINILNDIKKSYFLGKEKLLFTLSDQYKYSFNLNKISKLKKFQIYRIIGMGGSTLGAEAIYNFLKSKKIISDFSKKIQKSSVLIKITVKHYNGQYN